VRADAASIAVKIDQAGAIHKRRRLRISRDPPAMQRLAARFKSDIFEVASKIARREFHLALRDEDELALMEVQNEAEQKINAGDRDGCPLQDAAHGYRLYITICHRG